MAYRYRTIKVDGKTKLFHRHAAELTLGRPLVAGEHVHHGDENPWNNTRENLEVLPAEAHRKLHADERLIYPRDKACAHCGAVFAPAPTKRKRQKACSVACANTLRSITEKTTKATKACPPMAEALVRANFAHEALIYGKLAA